MGLFDIKFRTEPGNKGISIQGHFLSKSSLVTVWLLDRISPQNQQFLNLIYANILIILRNVLIKRYNSRGGEYFTWTVTKDPKNSFFLID